MNYITIALAKGRLGDEAYKLFKSLKLTIDMDMNSRKLVFEDDENMIRYIYVKPTDVITYVEKGVADLGIVGRDSILEQEGDFYELLDLNIGKCKFSIAGLKEKNEYRKDEILKVATKYPNTAKKLFKNKGQKIQIIKLNGSVELAPLVGLSHVIVDIVETGNTLKANGLKIIEDICDISAKVIANKVSYRFKFGRIKSITNTLDLERRKTV